MVGERQDSWFSLGRLAECLFDIGPAKQAVACSDIKATSLPATTLSRELVVVVVWVVRLPIAWGTSPVSKTAILHVLLRRVRLTGLVRVAEWDVLFQEPMAIGSQNMEASSVHARKPVTINDPSCQDLEERVVLGKVVGGVVMGRPTQRHRMIVKVESIIA